MPTGGGGDAGLHALSGLERSTGWRRWLAAFGSGAVSALAMAPWFAWLVLLATLPALVILLDGASCNPDWRRRVIAGAAIGWWFGFGYFVVGLYWIGNALLVEAESFAWLIPFAVTLIPAGLALFWALGCGVAIALWRPDGLGRVLTLAAALTVAEWLRGHVLTGFPWNEIGYALTAYPRTMQWTRLAGIAGLDFATVTLAALPVGLLARSWRTRLTGLLPLPAGIALMIGGGLMQTPPAIESHAVRVRLVQPNIAQAQKWDPELRAQLFQRLIDLSRRSPGGAVDDLKGIDVVVWPESSIPFLLLETPQALAAIAELLPAGAQLVTGALRAEPDSAAAGGRRIFNSIVVIDDDGRATAVFDKQHLVPFGEYLPLQGVLEAIGLQQLTRVRGGFAAGSGVRRLAIRGLGEVVPLVCYEAIFPEEAARPGPPATLLLNLTNDAWFGDSPGPYQHRHQARVRAVEQGLPLIRVANTGVSGVYDRSGRIVAELGLGTAGVLDVTVSLPETAAGPVAEAGAVLGLALLILVTPPLLRRGRKEGKFGTP